MRSRPLQCLCACTDVPEGSSWATTSSNHGTEEEEDIVPTFVTTAEETSGGFTGANMGIYPTCVGLFYTTQLLNHNILFSLVHTAEPAWLHLANQTPA